MKLRNVRGGSKEELADKKYNIGIGISLGNKWFTVENIVETIKWSMSNTREYVVVYVADSIHAINIEVRKKISRERALRIAESKGEEILSEVKIAAQTIFTQEEILKKIHFCRWSDLQNKKYKEKTDFLYSLYNTNTDFRNAIMGLVRFNISKEDKRFSDEDIHKLGTYIIEELPELLCRVPIKNIAYDAYVYPFDGELTAFVESIQIKEKFSEIAGGIIDTEPKVFLEVR